jgi:hypothetical protein
MITAKSITKDYDRWLAGEIPVVKRDVTRKHAEMRADPFRFLRGTYYLWLARVADRVPTVLDSARGPIVGDLHVENFGTWRDAGQVRRWGVNDLDELARGPWLLDPLRLAASARLAPRIPLGDKAVADTVLSAYAGARRRPAPKLSGKRGKHLRALVPEFEHEKKFYRHLAAGAPVDFVPTPVVEAALRVTEAGWRPRWYEHEAGTGSLGHLRRVGVGPADDGHLHAREAKQLGPGTAAWAQAIDPRLPRPEPTLFRAVVAAVKGPAAVARVADWHVRDLAPDVVRIELSGLRRGDARSLLTSMAEAAAGVHATDAVTFEQAQQEARELDPGVFRHLVDTMVACVEEDFAAYR